MSQMCRVSARPPRHKTLTAKLARRKKRGCRVYEKYATMRLCNVRHSTDIVGLQQEVGRPRIGDQI